MIRLYSYFRSTSAWRVRIALQLKALEHELVPVHLVRAGGEQFSVDFKQRNPLAQVPVLEIDEQGAAPFRLTQSMAILEYLEERWPAPALLPPEPELRARARQLAEMVNSGIQPLQNLKLQNELRALGVEPLRLVRGFVQAGLSALEQVASPAAGRFLVGNSVTFADVLLIPELGFARRHDISLEPYPLLRRVDEACAQLPAFQAAHPDAQPDHEPAT